MKTLKSNRFDNTALTLGQNVKETKQGFLVIPAFTARTGIQRYRMADGSMLNEHRPDDEVFSEASMDSLRTAPVTNSHPSEMVNPKNAKELIVGHTDGAIEKVTGAEESYLKTNLVITHAEAIDAIRAGKAELSNGYHVDLDFTPGEYNGQRYDAIQRNIINNHIAIVWKGRAGAKVSLKLDSNDAILIKDENSKGAKTMKIKIGDKEFDVNEDVANAFKKEMEKKKLEKEANDKDLKVEKEKNDSLSDEIEVLKGSKTRLTAKVDSLESEAEKAKTPKMDKAEVNKAVKVRIALVDTANKMLSTEEIAKLDEMENIEIKKAVIKADSPKTDDEKLKDETYVDARFDMVCENLDTSTVAKKNVGKKIIENRENNDDNDNNDYMSPAEVRQYNMDVASGKIDPKEEK